MSLREDEALIQRMLDGDLGEGGISRVEQRLIADAAFRKLYVSYAKSHHLLSERFETGGGVVLRMPQSPTLRGRRKVQWLAGMGIAAAVMMAMLFFFTRPRPHATFVFGPESKGRLEHQGGLEGTGVLWIGSKLELERGSVSIVMPSGVKGYIEGPGRMELEAVNCLRLSSGRAWFDVPVGAEGFVCATNSLLVEDLGTEFGVMAEPGKPEEVHVIKGKVKLHAIERPQDTRQLTTGEGTSWNNKELTPANKPTAFSTAFPEKVTVFSDNFDDPDGTLLDGKMPDLGAGPWRSTSGGMVVKGGMIDTRGELRNAAFAPLALPRLDDSTHVFLMTVEAEGPGDEGWAGVSLYTGDEERIFVGDPNGPNGDWALHPAGSQAINACPLLAGKSTVTLRYDYRTGLAELFEGSETTGPPLASQWIAPGLSFDRLRIANGSQLDAVLDARSKEEPAGHLDESRVRSNIAIRSIRATVLSAANVTRTAN